MFARSGARSRHHRLRYGRGRRQFGMKVRSMATRLDVVEEGASLLERDGVGVAVGMRY